MMTSYNCPNCQDQVYILRTFRFYKGNCFKCLGFNVHSKNVKDKENQEKFSEILENMRDNPENNVLKIDVKNFCTKLRQVLQYYDISVFLDSKNKELLEELINNNLFPLSDNGKIGSYE